MGMELRPYYLAREWGRMGHCAAVVAGGFSHLRRENPCALRALNRLTEDGVEFCVIKTPQYHANDWRRAVNVLSFTSNLRRYGPELARRYRPDAVIVSSTHPFDFSAAKKIARRCNAALIFELHDIWPLSLIELHGYSGRHPMMRLIEAAEKQALEQSDAVVSLLSSAARYCIENGITPKKLEYIPNAAANDPPADPPPGHRAALCGLRRKYGFAVVYAGGFSAANAVDLLPDLARRMPQTGFAAIGEGPLRETIARTAPENLVLLDAVDRRVLPPLLSEADALWLATRNLSVYRYGVAMNKLYDYMLCGRPVVFATACKDNPISRAQCGITVDPQEMIQTEAALEQLRAMTPSQRAEMGARGAQAVRLEYNYRQTAEKYYHVLEELANAKQRQPR